MEALRRYWPLIFIALASLLFGVVNETNRLYLWSFLVLGISVSAIQLLETKYSIIIVLTFIYFQGFFKVISNYHPIVHLGADIVVITLIMKFLMQKFFNRVKDETEYPPLYILFIAHFAWVFICLFNPYSLGFLPSIAGSKVYVTMLCLYFFGYYLVRSVKDVHLFFKVFVGFALVHAFFALVQGYIGPSSVVWIHPRYTIQLMKYTEMAFRPFGLTNLPGAPAVYIAPVLPFLMYFLLTTKQTYKKLLLVATLPFIGQTMLFCQVRSAIGKGLVGVGLFLFSYLTSQKRLSYQKKIYASSIVAASCLLVVVTIPYFMEKSIETLKTNEQAYQRSMTTFDYNLMSKARRNTMERFFTYAKKVPFGAGFSRVGASAGAFKAANKSDPFFGAGYFFADNLFITTLVEIGIPGLLFLSLIIFMILVRGISCWRGEERQELIGMQLAIFASLFSIFIGSYGAEGIIYNPESGFFWFFAGVLMRITKSDFGQEKL